MRFNSVFAFEAYQEYAEVIMINVQVLPLAVF